MSDTRFARLGARIFNQPHLIHPAKAEVIVAAISDRLGLTRIERTLQVDAGHFAILAPDYRAPEEEGESYRTHGYDVEMGVARIEVDGTLVAKNGSLRPESGMTGYDGIRQNFVEAMNDSRVKAVMFDIDSPGGEVAGCFDLVDEIYSARSVKPMWAVLTEAAFSGAYAIASAADRILVPRTGGTGSIGVVWMHADFSKAIDAAGIKVTFVQRGSRKTEGAAELPLSPEAQANIQAQIDHIGELFESTVARNRGLSTASIREMNAATFLGGEGVSLGLADEVMAPSAAFAALVDEISGA